MLALVLLLLFGGAALVWAGMTGQNPVDEARRVLGGRK